jgi:hypothetical protein
VALALVAGAPPLQAQSLLERTANISGDWVTRPGVVQFNFLHRFVVSDPPERKVTNFPTFTLATGIVSRVSAGANYTTNSVLAPRYPNEWELFARWQPLMQSEKTPVTARRPAGLQQRRIGRRRRGERGAALRVAEAAWRRTPAVESVRGRRGAVRLRWWRHRAAAQVARDLGRRGDARGAGHRTG